jgi:hypothetical protein
MFLWVRKQVGVLALLVFLSTAASAAEVAVEAPWARATAMPGGAGAAFMTIVNGGAVADRLVKAASPVAEVTELHTHLHEGGVMKMRAVPFIEVPANTATRLAPGGLHVMLIGLKAPLKEGETVPLTLSFEKAGELAVSVPVVGPAAMGPSGGAAMPGMPHGGGHGSPVK